MAQHALAMPVRDARRAFSMVELMVVLGVVVLLMSLLMPAIATVKENARRVVCASNLRQMGFATAQYAIDYKGSLPVSTVLEDKNTANPRELMASHRGVHKSRWDGLGLLFKHGYCKQPACFYCPSHHGDHPYERYVNDWWDRAELEDGNMYVDDPIYMNYHYGGHRPWDPNSEVRRRITDQRNGHQLVLATDGLRSIRDFNHKVGMNVLLADCSVTWYNSGPEVRPYLPAGDEEATGSSMAQNDGTDYTDLWDVIEELVD